MIFAAVWFLLYDSNMILLMIDAYTDQVIMDPSRWEWHHSYDFIGLFLALFFILMCFNPMDCFYRQARKELAWALLQVLFAPFGTVRFRDFFLADVITSMTTPLKDMGFIVLHLGTIDGRRDKFQKEYLGGYLAVISFAPFWWRFWQCLHKAYKSKNYWQVVNAGKYMSKWGPIIAGLAGSSKHIYDENGNFTSAYWAYFAT